MWLAPVTVSAPAVEPITLNQAKQFVRLDESDTAFDLELSTHIAGVAADAETIGGIRLIEQTVRIGAKSFVDLARLPIGPVRSVASIVYLDTAGAAQTLDPDAYELVGADLEQAIRPVHGASWPAAIAKAGAVLVTVVVGYAAASDELPADLRATLLLAIRARFDDASFDLEARLVNHRIWL